MTYAEVKVVFLPTSEGGRQQMPFLDDQCYRPHLRIGQSAKLLGVEFVDGPEGAVSPGECTYATVRLAYDTHVSSNVLKVGTEFEIVEGAQVVGRGQVTRR